jgi:putative hydrolase
VSDPDPVRQDMQVHSTFSDGADTVAANVAAAEAIGLVEMTCVDHVRVDTDWLPEYVAEVTRVRPTTDVRLTIGIEAKLLDTTGRLDMPEELPDGIEVIYAADHQVAMPGGVQHPDAVRDALAAGDLSPAEVFSALITSTRECLDDPRPIVIAHFLSILPKLGLDQADAPLDEIDALAAETARTGQRIEVNERYRTPSARTLRPFIDRGVPLLVSTDSHRADTIGRYDHCRAVLAELGVAPAYGRST